MPPTAPPAGASPLQGSHLEPQLDVALQLPDASASATVQLRRAAARVALASPSGDAAGTLHLRPPSFEAVKAAITQAEANALAQPNVTGLDADVSLRGLDAMPLISDQQAMRQLAVQSGQPLRLKLAGRARVSGTVAKAAALPAAVPAPAQGADADAGGGASSTSASSSGGGGGGGWVFSGDLGLEAVRVNQLKLWQKLAGRLSVSGAGVSVHGRGLRANETLDLDLALPLFQQPAPALEQQKQQQQQAAEAATEEPQQACAAPAAAAEGQEAEQAVAAADEPAEAEAAAATDAEAAAEQQSSAPAGPAPPPAVSEPAAAAAAAAAGAAQPTAQQQAAQQPAAQGGGGLQLRCGPLQVAANINSAGSQLDFKVWTMLGLGCCCCCSSGGSAGLAMLLCSTRACPASPTATPCPPTPPHPSHPRWPPSSWTSWSWPACAATCRRCPAPSTSTPTAGAASWRWPTRATRACAATACRAASAGSATSCAWRSWCCSSSARGAPPRAGWGGSDLWQGGHAVCRRDRRRMCWLPPPGPSTA